MRLKHQSLDDKNMEMNLIAMIDCLLLILIFFIVTAIMRKSHMEISIVTANHQSVDVIAPESERKILLIRTLGNPGAEVSYGVSTDADTVTGVTLEAAVAAAKRLSIPGQHVIFSISPRLEYGQLIKTIDAVTKAEVTWGSCAFVTEKVVIRSDGIPEAAPVKGKKTS